MLIPSKAATFALPVSDPSSRASSLEILELATRSEQDRRQSHRDGYTPEMIDYRDNLGQLVHYLPYLKVVLAKPRRMISVRDVICVDYMPDFTTQTTSIQNVHALHFHRPREAVSRVIILEDMDPYKVAMIGSAYGIGPKFFASHLRGSGYDVLEDEEESEQQGSWTRYRSAKTHFSFNWLRPVLPSLSITSKERAALLAGDEKKLRCIVPECDQRRHWS